jgi:hypothetical protein
MAFFLKGQTELVDPIRATGLNSICHLENLYPLKFKSFTIVFEIKVEMVSDSTKL